MTEDAQSSACDVGGTAFMRLRLCFPTQELGSELPLEVREKWQENRARALRVFRARSLPIPGDDARLVSTVGFVTDSIFGRGLVDEVRATLLKDIDLATHRLILEFLDRSGAKIGSGDLFRLTNLDEGTSGIPARDLLGKFWSSPRMLGVQESQ